jgi:uncharacterized protein YajQ (UPF0234 family)
MNSLNRLINLIIHDLRLFSQAEIDGYKARMIGADTDTLEAIMKEAKALESIRWTEYQATVFQPKAA